MKDTLTIDSIPADSIARIEYGMVMEMPDRPEAAPVERSAGYDSWITLGLFTIFTIICLRVRNSKKYLMALVRDLSDVRERHNAFDDTVRETSLLILLNIFWSCCAGVLIYYLLLYTAGANPSFSASLPVLHSRPTLCIAAGIGVALVYTLVMTVAYTLVGNVFSDRLHTKMWVKGFAAAQGVSTLLLFPIALLAIYYPQMGMQWLIAAAVVFAIGKIIFICKGIRIFFAQFSSWVLFLYYLCSLEIVPLILTYLLAWECCSLL